MNKWYYIIACIGVLFILYSGTYFTIRDVHSGDGFVVFQFPSHTAVAFARDKGSMDRIKEFKFHVSNFDGKIGDDWILYHSGVRVTSMPGRSGPQSLYLVFMPAMMTELKARD